MYDTLLQLSQDLDVNAKVADYENDYAPIRIGGKNEK